MSARDVIMDCGPVGCCVIAPEKADEILEALTAAGWSLVRTDEVDPVTVERCAEVARQYISDVGFPQPYATKAAAAIRAIASGGKQ